MGPDLTDAADDQSTVVYQWSARRLQPIVLLYVALVFLAMMAFGHFVVHSKSAVTALAMAAFGAIVPLVPAVLAQVEFRLTDQGLERRAQNKNKEIPKPFEIVFRFDELDRVVPVRHGFKYVKAIDESGPLHRFWKLHLSDECSGEIHVEAADRQRVLGLLAERRVAVRL